ncbi:hypothetical protein BGX26_007396, partial [Mortierella sp. AD094]
MLVISWVTQRHRRALDIEEIGKKADRRVLEHIREKLKLDLMERLGGIKFTMTSDTGRRTFNILNKPGRELEENQNQCDQEVMTPRIHTHGFANVKSGISRGRYGYSEKINVVVACAQHVEQEQYLPLVIEIYFSR